MTLEMATLEEALDSLGEPPSWWEFREQCPDERDTFALFDCMEYNEAPFRWQDVARVRLIHAGERDRDDWEWLVDLKDSARWYVVGGCDYTGWDCQSSARYARVPNGGSKWFEPEEIARRNGAPA